MLSAGQQGYINLRHAEDAEFIDPRLKKKHRKETQLQNMDKNQ